MIESQFTRIQSTSYLCQTSVDCRVCSECTSISIFQCPTCCAGSCHFYLIFLFLLHFLFSVFQCPAWRGCVVPAGCCHFYLPTTQGLIKHLLSIPWLAGSPLFCPVFSNTFYKIGRYKPNTIVTSKIFQRAENQGETTTVSDTVVPTLFLSASSSSCKKAQSVQRSTLLVQMYYTGLNVHGKAAVTQLLSILEEVFYVKTEKIVKQ